MHDPDLHDPESTPNPYAPSLIREEPNENAGFVSGAEQPPTVDPLRIIIRWSLVCLVSAAPSFVYGMVVTEGQIGVVGLEAGNVGERRVAQFNHELLAIVGRDQIDRELQSLGLAGVHLDAQEVEEAE